MNFKDRKDAGQRLSQALLKYKKAPQTVAIGLPRGGVVVASIVAQTLQISLDIIVPRKIGAPFNEELAIGAIAGDIVWLDQKIIAAVGANGAYIDKIVAKEKQEAQRRLSLFRKNKTPQNFEGLTVLLIDDGIATGSTMRASILWMKKSKAKRIVVAVPIGPPDTIEELKQEVDEMICLFKPDSFMGVSQFYDQFPQVEDQEVMELLK